MTRNAPNHTVWRERWNVAIHHLFWVVCVSAIYLATELTIWGLSFVLASAQLQYFGSIVGMIVIFSVMAAAGQVCPSCGDFYHRHIKSKVCGIPFLHAQLGGARGEGGSLLLWCKHTGGLYQRPARDCIQRAHHSAQSCPWHPGHWLHHRNVW